MNVGNYFFLLISSDGSGGGASFNSRLSKRPMKEKERMVAVIEQSVSNERPKACTFRQHSIYITYSRLLQACVLCEMPCTLG